jgi:hypothetical protein
LIVNWFSRWKPEPPPPVRDVTTLSGTELEDEHVRVEIEKMRAEAADERAWRAKLLLSLIVPLGAALAFCFGWWKDHSADREHRETQVYADAAQQLSSNDAAVRLNAIHTLDSFVHQQSGFASFFASPSSTGMDCEAGDDLRARQSVALIIGRLSEEQDAEVLDAISTVAADHPCLTLDPLLSVDRTAAVQFARAAGNFTAIYLLHKQKRVALDQGGSGADSLSQASTDVLDAVTTRSGSPFEAKDALNQVFVSAPLVTSGSICPFAELYNKQFELTASSALSSPLLQKPPSAADVRAAMQQMQTAAALLEKASYVLGRLATSKANQEHKRSGIDLLTQNAAPGSLFGVAIVVGELDESTVTSLQRLGAFVQQSKHPNTCPLSLSPTQ